MFCNNPTLRNSPNPRITKETDNANRSSESKKLIVSSKHVVYCFCNHSIPVAAAFTKNYKQFREIIVEHFVDTNTQIITTIRKINTEQTILTDHPDLPERNKWIIQNYIIKLKCEVEALIQVSDELQILKNNDKLIKKIFQKMHGS